MHTCIHALAARAGFSSALFAVGVGDGEAWVSLEREREGGRDRQVSPLQ